MLCWLFHSHLLCIVFTVVKQSSLIGTHSKPPTKVLPQPTPVCSWLQAWEAQEDICKPGVMWMWKFRVALRCRVQNKTSRKRDSGARGKSNLLNLRWVLVIMWGLVQLLSFPWEEFRRPQMTSKFLHQWVQSRTFHWSLPAASIQPILGKQTTVSDSVGGTQ